MSKKHQDTLIVRDASGRRSFLRQGAVFLVGTTSMTSSMSVFAFDCDRNSTDSRQKQATEGSDSDSGASADPAGCGQKKDEVPARFVHEPEDGQEIPEIITFK